MSRNKDIKFLHDFTGKSYKECRALMKAHHWDLGEAIGLRESLDFITKAWDGIIEAFKPFVQALSEAVTTVADAANKAVQMALESEIEVDADEAG
jgi:hypothetical protein